MTTLDDLDLARRRLLDAILMGSFSNAPTLVAEVESTIAAYVKAQRERDAPPAAAVEPIEGWYGPIDTPNRALYEAACAMDNQDVHLESWPERLIAALDRAGFAVVPVNLPHLVLGSAAVAGVFETGNPNHGWNYLVTHTRARFNPAPPKEPTP